MTQHHSDLTKTILGVLIPQGSHPRHGSFTGRRVQVGMEGAAETLMSVRGDGVPSAAACCLGAGRKEVEAPLQRPDAPQWRAGGIADSAWGPAVSAPSWSAQRVCRRPASDGCSRRGFMKVQKMSCRNRSCSLTAVWSDSELRCFFVCFNHSGVFFFIAIF